MKKYIVKDTIVDLKEERPNSTTYMGKDGYIHEFPEYADGWSRKHFAQRHIEEEFTWTWIRKIADNHAIESNRWLHIYEIIEVEESK